MKYAYEVVSAAGVVAVELNASREQVDQAVGSLVPGQKMTVTAWP